MHKPVCTAFSRLGLLCGSLVLGACTTLGPEYQEPEVDWLQNWQSSVYGASAAGPEEGEADLQFWWQQFNDPVLNRLIELARRENPSLRIAGLRILESRAQLGIAGSALYPQVQQGIGSATYINNRYHGGGVPDDRQSFVGYQAGFNIGWELDFWGRFKRGIESADAAFFASVADQQDVQVLLNAQIADLYFAYRTTQLRIVIARENAAIQKRSFEITDKIFKSGNGSELDVQQAKTQYLATLATIPNLELTLIQTRNALSALLGRAPGDLPELAGEIEKLPDIGSADIPAMPASLLLRRPDIRSAASKIAVQSAQIGIAEADFYPAISLLGSISWSGSTLDGSPDLGSLGVGPAFQWNLFDHGRIENNVRLQDARLQQLIESYQDTVLQAAREIDDAAVSVVKTAEQQVFRDQAVQASKRALDIANRRFREGYSDFQRVLDAQRSKFAQAENALVNHGSHINSVISLYKALGGGWQATPVEQLIPEDTRDRMQERTDWGDLLSAPLPLNQANPSATSGVSQK
jgi:NodT family efflux transporter outer membrane factor (OMF) lipoprotein